MIKSILTVLVVAASSMASNNLDYNLHIEGEEDTLYFGAALVVEGKAYRNIEGNHFVHKDGKNQKMSVDSKWDERQGIKAEIISKDFTLRAAYYDDHVGNLTNRIKNGSNKEDFFRKEDLVRFLELGLSNDQMDLYFVRDFNQYGTYTIGDDKPQPYSTSMMKAGVKLYGRAKPGSVGMLAEVQKFRTLRLLRIGRVNDDGNTEILSTKGPFNKEVLGCVAGIFKAPDPSGRLYVTYTFQGTIGVSESPFEGKQNIDMEGYYLHDEDYDLLGNLDGSIIAGFNMKLGGVRLRASAEAFVKTSYAAPMAQVYPNGVNEENVPIGEDIQDYKDQFTEEYSDYEIQYGYSAQAKIIF